MNFLNALEFKSLLAAKFSMLKYMKYTYIAFVTVKFKSNNTVSIIA